MESVIQEISTITWSLTRYGFDQISILYVSRQSTLISLQNFWIGRLEWDIWSTVRIIPLMYCIGLDVILQFKEEAFIVKLALAERTRLILVLMPNDYKRSGLLSNCLLLFPIIGRTRFSNPGASRGVYLIWLALIEV